MKSLLIQVLFILVFAQLAHAVDQAYLEELIQRARQLRLAESREWALLLHYKSGWLHSRARSAVDAEAFFNAPNGKDDPEAELQATLSRFFTGVRPTEPMRTLNAPLSLDTSG